MGETVSLPGGQVDIGAPEAHLDTISTQQAYSRAWFADEAPQHVVTVDAIHLDRAPVTNAQFAAFAAATGHVTAAERRGTGLIYDAAYWTMQPAACWRQPAPGIDAVTERPEHPVVHVDYDDATTYARWAGKRLPTEAEWEYAAHGPHWRAWPWSSDWDPDLANTAEYWAGSIGSINEWRSWWARRVARRGTGPATLPVGLFSPHGDSPLGVADMCGNVAEWTASPYHPYSPSRTYDPAFTAAMRRGYRVVRGGSWKHFRLQTRTTERIACVPYYSNFEIGFRCARDHRPAQTEEDSTA